LDNTPRSAATSIATGPSLRSLSLGDPSKPTSHKGSPQSSEENEPGGQPVPSPTSPVDSSFFSVLGASGQTGFGGGSFAPLLVGILAFVTILFRRNFRTYPVSLEMPKPSSALLLPLERPG
jgi:hypothetical protein